MRNDVWRTATFYNWKNAENIKKKLSNRCVEINRHGFNIWKNTACTKELGYVCEI
ncbi:C-type lectin domain-containing protein [Salmonella sp. s51944]|uniref:C-type lectin domain-containing protein n=1 Tax=Salmonella sp. s51944 TaxID=3159655 RepID=UPI00397FDD0E